MGRSKVFLVVQTVVVVLVCDHSATNFIWADGFSCTAAGVTPEYFSVSLCDHRLHLMTSCEFSLKRHHTAE